MRLRLECRADRRNSLRSGTRALTRPKARRLACRAGVVIGAVSLLAYVPCFFTAAVIGSAQRSFVLGHGAVACYWQPHVAGGNYLGRYARLDPGVAGTTWWRWLPKWVEPETNAPANALREMGCVVLPLWIPAAFGALCLYWLLPERPPWHTCGECGYDLRAIPKTAGGTTCPECGTVSA